MNHNINEEEDNHHHHHLNASSSSLSRLVVSSSPSNIVEQQGPELPSLDTPTVLLQNEAARRVRRNWLENINHLSRLGKTMLVGSTILTLAQILASIVVLAISRNDECDQPMRLFIIIYMVRFILVYPLSIYHHTHPRNQTTQITPRDRYLLQVADRMKSALDLLGMLWFILGNWWIFTSSSCYITSPSQFYLSLAFLILGYFLITLPLFLCGAVIFCLPCVIIIMRIFRISDPMASDGHHEGAPEEVIQKIAIVRFKPLSHLNDQKNMNEAPPVLNNTTSTTHHPTKNASKRIRWSNPSRWFRKNKKLNHAMDSSTTISMSPLDEPELALAQADALCVICLNDYEEGERLRQLPCRHHFHMTCVDEWLRLNRTCPLCVQDIQNDRATSTTTNNRNTNNAETSQPRSSETSNAATSVAITLFNV